MLDIVQEVLKKIKSSNFKAYAIGGFPRDLYLKRKSIDVDIGTNATPKELKEIFPNIKCSNKLYGSSLLMYKNIKFELTTFRKEIKYSNNRYPIKIKYINDLEKDLKRRDFIINTLCLDSDGKLIDLLGAIEDLDNSIIRTIGPAKVKLREDVLRMLRAIRFATVLNFKLDKQLEKTIIKYGYMVKRLSYERKREELEKIWTSSNVNYGIELLIKLNLIKHLELSNINNLKITSSLIGIWAQLDVINIYKFNNNELKSIKLVQELLNKDILDNYNLYKYGLYISTIAGEIKGIPRKDIVKKYNNLFINSRKEINLTPLEICEVLNKEPDSFLKKIILDIEEKIVSKKLLNNKDILKSYIIEKYSK